MKKKIIALLLAVSLLLGLAGCGAGTDPHNPSAGSNRTAPNPAVPIPTNPSGSCLKCGAVGLAHLLGADGLVDLLRAEGYTVELVTYAG